MGLKGDEGARENKAKLLVGILYCKLQRLDAQILCVKTDYRAPSHSGSMKSHLCDIKTWSDQLYCKLEVLESLVLRISSAVLTIVSL